MGLFESIVVFVIIWCLVLFTVLPFGVKSQAEGEADGTIERVPGTDPGAPITHKLGRKALITTGITIVLFILARAYIVKIFPQ